MSVVVVIGMLVSGSLRSCHLVLVPVLHAITIASILRHLLRKLRVHLMSGSLISELLFWPLVVGTLPELGVAPQVIEILREPIAILPELIKSIGGIPALCRVGIGAAPLKIIASEYWESVRALQVYRERQVSNAR